MSSTSNLEIEFQSVCSRLQQIQLLQSTQALLEWDQHTYLPRSAGDYRADQIGYLAGEIHQRKSDPALLDSLHRLQGSDWLKSAPTSTKATVSQLCRELDKAARLPQSLVQALARACSLGQQRWIEAKNLNDFSRFAPALESILNLKREQAQAYQWESTDYDALLDDFEPGMTSDRLGSMFRPLVAELRSLICNLPLDRPSDSEILCRRYSITDQERFGREVASAIGFDFSRGRLDVTHHPFCTELGPDDCRILTRYQENNFGTALFGTLHEAGHGMYEQGLPKIHYGLPPGQYCSLGVHESQSRLWENLVGRSSGFWNYWWPRLVNTFPSVIAASEQLQFEKAINQIKPSLIRVEADEATYNLHIVIRFELECELLEQKVPVRELPEAWNDRYKEYLGIQASGDFDGVLQDVHWSAGLFGYFPTYTLGNLYACQLFEAAEAALGNLEEQFVRGEFGNLLGWLRENVHRWGRTWSASELLEKATGQTLSQVPLVRHLRAKIQRICRS